MKLRVELTKEDIFEALKKHIIDKNPEFSDASFNAHRGFKSYIFIIDRDGQSKQTIEGKEIGKEKEKSGSQ